MEIDNKTLNTIIGFVLIIWVAETLMDMLPLMLRTRTDIVIMTFVVVALVVLTVLSDVTKRGNE